MQQKSITAFGVIILICLLTGVINGADALPEWYVGSWWDYSSITDVRIQEDGSPEYADLVITDQNTRHDLASIEMKTLTHGTPATYLAYILPFSGTADGEGVYYDPDYGLIPIEIRNANLEGEWWVDTETLGTVYYVRHIDGPLWAQIPIFGWQEVGTVDITIHEEYEPARDFVNFPIDVGNEWQSTVTLYTFGEYVIDAEIFGEPIYEADTFDESETLTVDYIVPILEVYNGYLSYRIEGDETGSSGTILAFYSSEPKTLVYEQMEDFGSSGGVQINSFTRILENYYLEPGPTPTPTPVPDCLNHGDVNFDGQITAADAQLAFLIALGQYSPTYEEECAADCNGDGIVTAADAQLIFLAALGSDACVDDLG